MRGLWSGKSTDNDNSHPGGEPGAKGQSIADSTSVNGSGISSLMREAAASATPTEFRTTTVAPSPPPKHLEHFTSSNSSRSHSPDSLSGGSPLRISTDVPATITRKPIPVPNRDPSNTLTPSRIPLNRTSSASSVQLARTPSSKSAFPHSHGSIGNNPSATSSPVLAAMGDVTPLPSPLMSSDSPGPWKRLNVGSVSPPQRRDRIHRIEEDTPLQQSQHRYGASTSPPKRRIYGPGENANIAPAGPPSTHSEARQTSRHTRNRSVSEYKPDPPVIQKRQVVVSGSHANIEQSGAVESSLRRETNLAESRGLTPSVAKPPTPPPSESSRDSNESITRPKDEGYEYFKARGRDDQKQRRWRSLGLLGRGTFSRVMLATSRIIPSNDGPELQSASPLDCTLDRKSLVAVKVCEHGPRGGASEDRVEMSLKRELEIMQVIRHPSLVDLKAWSIEPTRAILVMSFCPGGDLFDVATTARSALTPGLIRRMFAELVAAVRYLHERNIVHRDIKLENVLVNVDQAELSNQSVDWATYPHSVVALADLGLSRRVVEGEQLETRCGSDDYAAPEVIMGQSYDGKATDAWSLGVLLYALLEARLPFDPHPGMSDAHRMRSRTSHRIARVEWRWIEYAGEDGDHEGDEAKFEQRELLGAMEIVEGLLKRARSRWSLEKVAAQPWVAGEVAVNAGLKFREEDEAEEVS